jgi:hypothetical protein
MEIGSFSFAHVVSIVASLALSHVIIFSFISNVTSHRSFLPSVSAVPMILPSSHDVKKACFVGSETGKRGEWGGEGGGG